jgi:vacuolar-type H+-ATPase subunit E/Vma4
MAIIWDQPVKDVDEEIEEIIEEAEQASEIKEEIKAEQTKSPFRGFAN